VAEIRRKDSNQVNTKGLSVNQFTSQEPQQKVAESVVTLPQKRGTAWCHQSSWSFFEPLVAYRALTGGWWDTCHVSHKMPSMIALQPLLILIMSMLLYCLKNFVSPLCIPLRVYIFQNPTCDNSIAAIYRKKWVWYACVSFFLRKLWKRVFKRSKPVHKAH
jgi:hypothetical protein